MVSCFNFYCAVPVSMNTIKMALDRKLVVFLSTFVILICGLLLHVSAQTFTEQPQSFIGLKPGDNSLTDLECAYTTQNADDVVGWVVNDIRISNGNIKISEAITSVLGSEAISQLQPSLSGTVYDLVFFSVTPVVAGDYRCQLCTNDGNNGCGTVLIESDVSQVQVEYTPTEMPTCLPTSSTTRVVLGEAVMLSCASEPGLPVVELEWLRNSAAISGQPEPLVMNGILYNNFSYTPDVSDIGVQLTCRMQSASNPLNCQSPTFNIVSTPIIVVFPPDPNQVPAGSEAVYTCQATSLTNTPINTYGWQVENIPASRYTVIGNTLTIASVTVGDHGKTIQCEATDQENMKGMGERVILVAREVVPSNLPTVPTRSVTTVIPSASTSAGVPSGSIATIIGSAVGAVLVIVIVISSIFIFDKRRSDESASTKSKGKKSDSSPQHENPIFDQSKTDVNTYQELNTDSQSFVNHTDPHSYQALKIPDQEANNQALKIPDQETNYQDLKKPDQEATYQDLKKPDQEANYQDLKKPDQEANYQDLKKPDQEANHQDLKKPDPEANYQDLNTDSQSFVHSTNHHTYQDLKKPDQEADYEVVNDAIKRDYVNVPGI